MNDRSKYIIIAFLTCISCGTHRSSLVRVDNSELRTISDELIYSELTEEFRNKVVFNGAYEGFQCYPVIEDFNTQLDEQNLKKNETFKCICYDYKVMTEQGQDLYIGFKNGYYLNTRVCYDSSNSIVEHPKIQDLKLALARTKCKHLSLSTVKSITEDLLNLAHRNNGYLE